MARVLAATFSTEPSSRAGAAPSGAAPAVRRVTLRALQRLGASGTPIVVLTAYDFAMAQALGDAADILLIGDSVGMVALGYESTVRVTMDDMARACAAVARGGSRAFLVGDLPFGSYLTRDAALANAARLVQEGGVDAVKLEGGRAQAGKIAALVREGVPVMGHVGLLPQTARAVAGYALRGASEAEAAGVVADALAVADAGAFAIVLEKIPAPLAALVTAAVAPTPTIGIGAGPACGGQVLVSHDALGMLPPRPSGPLRFVRQYADVHAVQRDAATAYAADVRARTFPSPSAHAFPMRAAAAAALSARLQSTADAVCGGEDRDSVGGGDDGSDASAERWLRRLAPDVRRRALAAFAESLAVLPAVVDGAATARPLASAAGVAVDAAAAAAVPAPTPTLFPASAPVTVSGGDARRSVLEAADSTAVERTGEAAASPGGSATLRAGAPATGRPAVAVVGSGSLGLLFATRLSAVADVTLVCGSPARAAELRAAGGPRVAHAPASAAVAVIDLPALLPRSPVLERDGHAVMDAVLLLTKAPGAPAAASAARALCRRGTGFVLPLYNGGYTYEFVRAAVTEEARSGGGAPPLLPSQVLYGVTAQGAMQDAGGHVVDTGAGDTLLAAAPAADGAVGGAASIARLLSSSGLRAIATTAPVPVLRWAKLAVNAVLNPVAAVLGLRNGDVAAWAADARRRGRGGSGGAGGSLLDALAAEAAAVLDATLQATPGSEDHLRRLPGWGDYPGGGGAGADFVAAAALRVAAATAGNVSSMLADARAGRPGEARFVSGFVWDEGRRLGAGRGAGGDGGLAPTHAAVAAHLLRQQRLLRIDEPPPLPNMPALP